MIRSRLLEPTLADVFFKEGNMGILNVKSRRLISFLLVLVGNVIFALTVKLFVLPANLMSCGTTGIAMALNHLLNIPISAFLLVFNIIMLIVGWCVLGKKFAMSTVLSSLLYPILLELFNQLLGDVSITTQPLLNVLFAGMGLGLSLGIVIRAGASTGGMDIPPLILERLFRIPVSASLWVFDLAILLAQMSFHPLEDLLYGILLILTVSVTLNKIILLGTSRTEVKIISGKAEEIREGILSKVDRGVTLLHGESGYLRQSTEVILTVVSNYELPKVEQLARSIDPDCFVIINRVSEVWGRGFTYGKQKDKK